MAQLISLVSNLGNYPSVLVTEPTVTQIEVAVSAVTIASACVHCVC